MPLIWTATVEEVLAKLRDCQTVIETFH